MLTDTKLRAVKPTDKAFRLVDAGGLHLYVSPSGTKAWRWRYKVGGAEKLLSLGRYPSMGLAAARGARDAARAVLKDGKDPAMEKKTRKLLGIVSTASTFEAIARAWHTRSAPAWSPKHAALVLHSLEQEAFPAIGAMHIRDVTPPIMLATLRQIEARGSLETARRVRQRCSAVFVHAISCGLGEQDPAGTVQKAMAPVTRGRQPAIVDLEEAREMLRAAEATPAHPVTKLALRFLALTAVRPGELHAMPWRGELVGLDGDSPTWIIPAARMKMRRDHLVPLAPQAVEVLEAVKRLSGKGPMVFPNARHAHKPMSENALAYLLHRAGYHARHVPHGWRSTFSTVMNETHRPDRNVIDLMLAHVPENTVEAAYNRAAYIARRRELAIVWADMLLADFAPAAALLDGPQR